MCVKEIKQPGSEGQIQMASVFILKMRILRQKEHGSKQERRLGLCLAHSITMSGMWRFDQRKEGETVSGSPSSWILRQEAMDYACAPPGKKTRLKMTISNTLTVRSARLLTTLTIRWMRLYMSAHSYAVTFHCILINTWLNQARTTLLITQDKKNTTVHHCVKNSL